MVQKWSKIGIFKVKMVKIHILYVKRAQKGHKWAFWRQKWLQMVQNGHFRRKNGSKWAKITIFKVKMPKNGHFRGKKWPKKVKNGIFKVQMAKNGLKMVKNGCCVI